MKTLVISDLHLTHRNYSENKLNYLTQLINKYDQVIINGDLWCAFTSTFDEFYNSKWNTIFDVLKRHHCIYIEGNHDLFEYTDGRIKLLCDQNIKSYELQTEKYNILFVHGHTYGHDWHKSRIEVFLRRFLNLEAIPILIEETIIHVLGFDIFVKIFCPLGNQKQKKLFNKTNINKLVVMGHTHCMENDIANNYINTGRVGSCYASYLSITENNISLNFERF